MELFNEVLGSAGVPDGSAEPPAEVEMEAETQVEVEVEAVVETEDVPVKAPKKGRAKKT